MSIAAGLVLGFIISLIYAFVFQLLIGGSYWRLCIYLIVSLFGFSIGQIAGREVAPDSPQLGILYLQYATRGAIAFLILSHIILGNEKKGQLQ